MSRVVVVRIVEGKSRAEALLNPDPYDDGSDGVHQPTSSLSNLFHFKQDFACEAHLMYSSIVWQPSV